MTWLKSILGLGNTKSFQAKLREDASNDNKMRGKLEPKVLSLGRLPVWSRNTCDEERDNLRLSKRANRYLKHQEGRIYTALLEGKYTKAVLIWTLLIKRSFSYQLTLYNRVEPKWYYERDTGEVKSHLRHLSNKLWHMDLKLLIERYYLQKPNGKWRPVGAPDIVSRCISKAFNDMVYHVTKDDRDMFQHGFKQGKGVQTAMMDVAKSIREGKKVIYEFDFKSFFNNVNIHYVWVTLAATSPLMANLVKLLITGNKYTWGNTQRYDEEEWFHGLRRDDKELCLQPIRFKPEWNFYKSKWDYIYEGKGPYRLMHTGLPQGLNISPILATMILKHTNLPTGLVMYADDGLIFGENKEEMARWFSSIAPLGALIEPNKSGWVKDKFKFLGITIDLERETFEYNTSKISIHDPCLEEWLKNVTCYYGKKGGGWTWLRSVTLNGNPMVKKFVIEFNVANWKHWRIIIQALWNGGMYKGYRYFIGLGIVDVIGTSSLSINSVLQEKRVIQPKRRPTRNWWIGDQSDWGHDLYNAVMQYGLGVIYGPGFKNEITERELMDS